MENEDESSGPSENRKIHDTVDNWRNPNGGAQEPSGNRKIRYTVDNLKKLNRETQELSRNQKNCYPVDNWRNLNGEIQGVSSRYFNASRNNYGWQCVTTQQQFVTSADRSNRGPIQYRTRDVDRKVADKDILKGNEIQYLQRIAQSSEAEFIILIYEKYDAILNLLNSPIEQLDIIVLIIKVVSRFCLLSLNSVKIDFLLDVCNTQFIVYLRNYLMDLPYAHIDEKRDNKMYWRNPNTFWENLITFYEGIIVVAPSVVNIKCKSLIEDTSRLCLKKLRENHNFRLNSETNSKLEVVMESLKTSVAKSTTKKSVENSEPPDDFRQLSVYPTKSELLEVKPFLRPNIINGAYRDVEHYLDVQFRLLREDCFGPLRDGLLQVIKDPTKHRYDNIRVYRNVRFVSPYMGESSYKIGSLIEFDEQTRNRFRNVNWSESKRLKFGTLLLLTKDNWHSFIVTKVLDHVVRGQIPVEIMNSEVGDEIYNDEYYTMIESEVYFEPYLHVLEALQDPSFPRHLAMKKYIVYVDNNPTYPQYLQENTTYNIYESDEDDSYDECIEIHEDIDKSFSVMNIDTWPTMIELGFNSSQYEAYKVALTHEFGVIQGPPGTGKTFLGVKIAKTLLRNVNVRSKCKMLLVCYTNHALDQFLEALLPFTNSIARVGGQSRSASMELFNLNNLRRTRKPPEFGDARKLRNIIKDNFKFFVTNQNIVNVLPYSVLKIKYLIDSSEINETSRYILQEIQNTYNLSKVDPMCLWLFQKIDLHKKEQLNNLSEDNNKDDEALLDGGQHNYNYIKGGDAYWNLKENSHYFCFSLAIADDAIDKLISQYNTADASEDELNSNIRKWRTKIRLFLQMRELYTKQKDTININTLVDITGLPIVDRWMLYFQWADMYKNAIKSEKKRFSRLEKCYREKQMEEDFELLRSVKVIGMTTTGAARHRNLIRKLGPPIVIIEEAAEVLEQHVITSLTKNCQHLILIGDHKQLRPSAAHMRLARHFNIEVSLFERMILNDVHSRRLNVQHRMRPEFAALLVPHIYPDLQNHPSVADFPDVRGLATNLFFFNHDFKELREEDNASKCNPQEADMVLLLANYIKQQGYADSDITILAAYTGQMFYMQKARNKFNHLTNVKITSIDNYQGEESKIILLSLVRNNDNNQIGFLGTENRVCVALSRAREGFYMFGNMDILKNNSTLWSTIDKILRDGGHIGASMRFTCGNHGTQTMITSAKDFENVSEGGCALRCDYVHPCGHRCDILCHSYDSKHENIRCMVICKRTCELNHEYEQECWKEPCCEVMMPKKFPCGHTNIVPCHVDPEHAKCQTEIDWKLNKCGHEKKIRCYIYDGCNNDCGHSCAKRCHGDGEIVSDGDGEIGTPFKDVEQVSEGCCTLKCDCVLPCGHKCPLDCHPYDVKHTNINCKISFCQRRFLYSVLSCDVIVTKELPCGHTKDVRCHQDPKDIKCQIEVDIKMPSCGHEIRVWCERRADATCSSPCDHRIDSCGHKCARTCHSSGRFIYEKHQHACKTRCTKTKKGCTCESDDVSEDHKCTRMCHEDCEDCDVPTMKTFTTCEHKMIVACHERLGNRPCKMRCKRELPCKHLCEKKCDEPCGDCQIKVEKVISDCKHKVLIKCKLEATRSMCGKKCERKLACGHACSGLCRDICDPAKCAVPVATALDAPCGHKVSPPCNATENFNKDDGSLALLKFCTEACGAQLECGHACGGSCGACQQGRLHVACDQPCTKINLCGHPCTGPCNKICPPCKQTCQMKCAHSKCPKLCTETCTPCPERCTRGCEHSRCSRLCGQPCSRQPCEERCPRPLPCGHACRGFCGEPCPNICKLCRPEEFPKDSSGDEFDDSAVFVLLEDCGDILHFENIENIMNNSSEIIIFCPLCSVPIINTQRYKDRINHTFKEIGRLHKKLRGDYRTLGSYLQELTKDLNESFNYLKSLRGKVVLSSEFLIVYEHLRKIIDRVSWFGKRLGYNLLDIEMIYVHLNIFKILCKYYCDYYSLTNVKTLYSEINGQVKIICKCLVGNLAKLSVQQQQDLEKELNRVHAITNLAKALNHPNFANNKTDPKFMEAEANARKAILGWYIFNHKLATDALDVLQDIIGENFMTQKHDIIVKELDLVVGNYLKCPNGRFYYVGGLGNVKTACTCSECEGTPGSGTSDEDEMLKL